tara:strand:+ start:768 stop:1019 length:252 start_codon:yes stop_codon:yes gene_type:complete
MSVELLYIMLFLMGLLFVNEHYISKELRRRLFEEAFLKEVQTAITEEALNEVVRLDTKVTSLQEQLSFYEEEEQKETAKVMGT